MLARFPTLGEAKNSLYYEEFIHFLRERVALF